MNWKDIEYYEGLYQISDCGSIRNAKGHILVQDTNNKGYKVVHLYRNNERVHYYVHRLVAKAFLNRERYDQLQVNHIDNDKQNNHVSNLEWVNQSENSVKFVEQRLSKTQMPVKLLKGNMEYDFRSCVQASRFLKRNDDYVSSAIRKKRKTVTDITDNIYMILV